MYKLTAADFADTGQWRLRLNIGFKGLEAFLENTLHAEIEPQKLCAVAWEENPETLKKNLEEAVYNNPRLLDDFATKIVLYDLRTLLIPKDIAEESAGAEEDLYNEIYKAEETDVMTDSAGDVTAVWCPGPGVKSFLMRTFPGARVTCNLLERVRETGKTVRLLDGENVNAGDNKTVRLFEGIRTGEVDLVLMEGERLLSASTHLSNDGREKDWLRKRLLEAYDLESAQVEILPL